jgi:hypothetical protein
MSGNDMMNDAWLGQTVNPVQTEWAGHAFQAGG